MEQKVAESVKSWKSTNGKKNVLLPDPVDEDFVDIVVEMPIESAQGKSNLTLAQKSMLEAKTLEFVGKNKWNVHRFPDPWLVWYVFGPPKCCGHPNITSTEMQHLTKIKAAKPLTEEEHVIEMGTSHKINRRLNKKNRTGGDSGKEKSPGDEDGITSVSSQGMHSVTIVRPPPTAIERLNETIAATKELILQLEKMVHEDGDDDGSIKEEIVECRFNLRQLLRDKITECNQGRSVYKRGRASNDDVEL